MNKSINYATALFLFIIVNNSLLGQKRELTYEQVFKGAATNLLKPLPTIIRWLSDDQYLEARRDREGNPQMLKVEAKTGRAVPYAGRTPEEGTEQEVVIKNGDIYIRLPTAILKQLTQSEAMEMNPTISPDGKWIAFTRNNNLYAIEISSEREVQFTSDGSRVIYNGYASWVYFEEILGRASRYKAFWWSNDSRRICFMRFDDSKVPEFPIYYAEGQHGFLEMQHYPKAGDNNPLVRIGIVSVDKPAVVWSDFDQKADQYFGTPLWAPSGELWVQWMPRSQDTLKVFAVDPERGTKKEIYEETQKTWIDLDDTKRIDFLQNTFILKSDKSGWAHLYFHDMAGKLLNPITQGNFTVSSIEKANQKAKLIYFLARKENSARFDLYKVGFDGKGLTRLTFGAYTHAIQSSPNMKYFISTYSNISTPPKMALFDGKGTLIRELGDSKGEAFDTYHLPKTELVRVKSQDGLFDLPMTITYPLNFDANKKYPVLVSIYGGPHAGTVYDAWKSTVEVTAWWAKEGIIQVAMDNRSSGHFGKQGMNFIYRQLGKFEIEDYMQCARWLKEKSFVDGSKICIIGSSFGGYITCMALTYGASEFTHGIAGASVTDWRLYDTHYTERFMDTPLENPEGYKNTAILTHVEKYKGLLRIVHGTTDDNVHMQNSIQLIDKLQDLGKHFEFMLYPGERHGIGRNNPAKAAHNRLESYKFLYKNLLNKGMPPEFNE